MSRPPYGRLAAVLALVTAMAGEAITPAHDICLFDFLTSTSFTDADSTAGRIDDYDPGNDLTCPAVGGGGSFLGTGAGPDLVYHILPDTSGSVTARVDPAPAFDVSIYVVSGCTNGLFFSGCIVGDDSTGAGNFEQVTFSVTAGTHYYIIVDGFSGSSGPFTLTVTGLSSPLDIDGDGEVDPLTDGLLMLRYDFGFRNGALITGAVDLAHCARCDSTSIEVFIALLKASA